MYSFKTKWSVLTIKRDNLPNCKKVPFSSTFLYADVYSTEASVATLVLILTSLFAYILPLGFTAQVIPKTAFIHFSAVLSSPIIWLASLPLFITKLTKKKINKVIYRIKTIVELYVLGLLYKKTTLKCYYYFYCKFLNTD